MIRKEEVVRKVNYVLSEKEARLVEYCINYCRHRKYVHKSPGLSGIDGGALDTMSREFLSGAIKDS